MRETTNKIVAPDSQNMAPHATFEGLPLAEPSILILIHLILGVYQLI